MVGKIVSLPTSGTSASSTSGEAQLSRVFFGTAASPGRAQSVVSSGSRVNGGVVAGGVEVQLDAADAVAQLLRGHHARPEPLRLAGRPAGQRGEEVARLAPAGHRAGVFAVGLAGVAQHPAQAGLPGGQHRRLVLVGRNDAQDSRRAGNSRGCIRRSTGTGPGAAA